VLKQLKDMKSGMIKMGNIVFIIIATIVMSFVAGNGNLWLEFKILSQTLLLAVIALLFLSIGYNLSDIMGQYYNSFGWLSYLIMVIIGYFSIKLFIENIDGGK